MSTQPDGKYYSAAYPFLSACLAISCGTLDEQRRFWQKAEEFCRTGYGLNSPQTAALLAPSPKFGITPCHADNDQIDAVLDLLQAEVAAGHPSKGTIPPLETNLARFYPSLVALHKALCLDAGSAPPNYRRDVKNEWVEFQVPW